MRIGRIEEAIVPLESSKRLEPQAVRIYLVMAYFLAGRYRDSLALSDSLLVRAPDHVALNTMRAASLAELGNLDEARKAAAQVRRFSPNFSPDTWGRGFAKAEHAAKVHEAMRKAGL